MTLVIAHRGASALEVENSLAAFRRATLLAADAVELDIHATRDGVLVVHHDAMIDGHSIPDAPFDALAQLRLPNGEPIPTLTDALEAIGKDMITFIEVKTLPPEHDDELFRAIDGAPHPSRCHVHGFDHRIVHRLLQERPRLVGGVLSSSYPVHPLIQLSDVGATELWQERSLVDPELVAAMHEAGCRVYAWTVEDPDLACRLAAWGVDGICTNQPDVLRRALA